MKKTTAVDIFGNTQNDLAAALEITPQAVSKWPEVLKQDQVDRVIGAAIRLKREIPHEYQANKAA